MRLVVAIAAVLLALLLFLPHAEWDGSLRKNPYWPFTVELSVRDR